MLHACARASVEIASASVACSVCAHIVCAHARASHSAGKQFAASSHLVAHALQVFGIGVTRVVKDVLDKITGSIACLGNDLSGSVYDVTHGVLEELTGLEVPHAWQRLHVIHVGLILCT